MKKNLRSHIATLIGVMGAIINAIATDVNIDTFNTHSKRDWLKLFMVIAPIVVGAFTEIKPKKVKDEQ